MLLKRHIFSRLISIVSFKFICKCQLKLTSESRCYFSACFFSVFFFFGVETGAAAHGRYRWHQIAWAHINTAFNGGICQQNMHFNMYTTISKPQEGPTCKDSHAKCLITTNSPAKLSPGAVNRGEL